MKGGGWIVVVAAVAVVALFLFFGGYGGLLGGGYARNGSVVWTNEGENAADSLTDTRMVVRGWPEDDRAAVGEALQLQLFFQTLDMDPLQREAVFVPNGETGGSKMGYEVLRVTPADFAGKLGGGYYVTNYFVTYQDRSVASGGLSFGMAGTYELHAWAEDDGTLDGYELQDMVLTLTVG